MAEWGEARVIELTPVAAGDRSAVLARHCFIEPYTMDSQD